MTCCFYIHVNKYQYILKTVTFSYTRSQVAYRDYFGRISTISNMFLVQMYSKWIQCSCSVERSLTFCSIVYLSSHDIQHCIEFFFIFYLPHEFFAVLTVCRIVTCPVRHISDAPAECFFFFVLFFVSSCR